MAVVGRCVSSVVTFVVSCSSCVVSVATFVVRVAVLLVTSSVVCWVKSLRKVVSFWSRCSFVTVVVASWFKVCAWLFTVALSVSSFVWSAFIAARSEAFVKASVVAAFGGGTVVGSGS